MKILFADYCLCRDKNLFLDNWSCEWYTQENKAVERFKDLKSKCYEAAINDSNIRKDYYFSVHFQGKHILTIKE